MTNQQYISISKLLEQNNPELFEQYKSQLSIEIDVEVLFNNFCETIGRFPVNIVGKPYNREANKNKALFVGVLITELKTEKIPHGMKKKLAILLGIDAKKIGGFLSNTTLFLSIYCDFKNEVCEICTKIKKHNESVQVKQLTG